MVKSKKKISIIAGALVIMFTLLAITYAWFTSDAKYLNGTLTTAEMTADVNIYDDDGKEITIDIDDDKSADNDVVFANCFMTVDADKNQWQSAPGESNVRFIEVVNTGSLDINTYFKLFIDSATENEDADDSTYEDGDNTTYYDTANYFYVIENVTTAVSGISIAEYVSKEVEGDDGVVTYPNAAKSYEVIEAKEQTLLNLTTGQLFGETKVGETMVIRIDYCLKSTCTTDLADKTIGAWIYLRQTGQPDDGSDDNIIYDAGSYTALLTQLDYAVDGDIIRLTNNIETPADTNLIISRRVSLDLNGYNLTIKGNMTISHNISGTQYISTTGSSQLRIYGNLYIDTPFTYFTLTGGTASTILLGVEDSVADQTIIGGRLYADVVYESTRTVPGLTVSYVQIKAYTYETNELTIKYADIYLDSNSFLSVSSYTQIGAVYGSSGAKNIAIYVYGTIDKINLSSMSLMAIGTEQIYILVYGTFTTTESSITLPSWSINKATSGANTRILKASSAGDFDVVGVTSFDDEHVEIMGYSDSPIDVIPDGEGWYRVNLSASSADNLRSVEDIIENYIIEQTTNGDANFSYANFKMLEITSTNVHMDQADFDYIDDYLTSLWYLDLTYVTFDDNGSSDDETVDVGSTLPASALYGNKTITDIILPTSLEYIGASAFQTSVIENITLGNYLKSIGNLAFRSSLEDGKVVNIFLPAGEATAILATASSSNCAFDTSARLFLNDSALIEFRATYDYTSSTAPTTTSRYWQAYAYGQLTDYGNYYINISGEQSAEISYFSGSIATGDSIVPSTVTYGGKAYSVTGVRGHAYYDQIKLFGNEKSFKVELPSTCLHVGEYAFAWSWISDLDLNAVRTISKDAFVSTTITNSDERAEFSSMTSVGNYAFASCTFGGIINLASGAGATFGTHIFYGAKPVNSGTVVDSEDGDQTSSSEVLVDSGIYIGMDDNFTSNMFNGVTMPNILRITATAGTTLSNSNNSLASTKWEYVKELYIGEDVTISSLNISTLTNLEELEVGEGSTIGTSVFLSKIINGTANVTLDGCAYINTTAFQSCDVGTISFRNVPAINSYAFRYLTADEVIVGFDSIPTGGYNINAATDGEDTYYWSTSGIISGDIGTLTIKGLMPGDIGYFVCSSTSTTFEKVVVTEGGSITQYMLRDSTIKWLDIEDTTDIYKYGLQNAIINKITEEGETLAVFSLDNHYLGDYAFYGATINDADSFLSITFSSSISSYTFYNTTFVGLQSIISTAASGNEATIGSYAFRYLQAENLVTLNLSYINTIDTYAFADINAPNMTTMDLSYVQKMNNYAFRYATIGADTIYFTGAKITGDYVFGSLADTGSTTITAGTIYFTGATISGSYAFGSTSTTGTIIKANKISFENAEISGANAFRYADIDVTTSADSDVTASIDFNNATISGTAMFAYATIDTPLLSLDNALFGNTSSFYGATIDTTTISAGYAEFAGQYTFGYANITADKLDLSYLTVTAAYSFAGAKIAVETLDLQYIDIQSTYTFGFNSSSANTSINATTKINMDNASIAGNATFGYTTIVTPEISLESANVTGTTTFSYATITVPLISLDGATIAGASTFNRATINATTVSAVGAELADQYTFGYANITADTLDLTNILITAMYSFTYATIKVETIDLEGADIKSSYTFGYSSSSDTYKTSITADTIDLTSATIAGTYTFRYSTINAGTISFSGATIASTYTFANSTINASTMDLSNSTIASNYTFNSATIDTNSINLSSTIISGTYTFNSASIYTPEITFNATQISGAYTFNSASFEELSSLELGTNLTISAENTFKSTTFSNLASLTLAEQLYISANNTFNTAQFPLLATLTINTTENITGGYLFNSATFTALETLDVKKVTITSDYMFYGATFEKLTSLSVGSLTCTGLFSYTKFIALDTLTFDKSIEISGDSTFRYADFDVLTTLNFGSNSIFSGNTLFAYADFGIAPDLSETTESSSDETTDSSAGKLTTFDLGTNNTFGTSNSSSYTSTFYGTNFYDLVTLDMGDTTIFAGGYNSEDRHSYGGYNFAYANFYALTGIDWGSNVEFNGYYEFRETQFSVMESLTINNGVLFSNYQVFRSTMFNSLESLTIDSAVFEYYSITSDDQYGFMYTSFPVLTSLVITANATIADRYLFYAVTFTSLPQDALTVATSSTITGYGIFTSCSFPLYKELDYTLVDGVGSYGFQSSTFENLTTINIDDGDTVSSYCFSGLKAANLTKLNISGTTTSVYSYAFSGATTALTNDDTANFTINLKNVKSIGTGALSITKISDINLTFDESITSTSYGYLLYYSNRTVDVGTITLTTGDSYPSTLNSSGVFGAYAYDSSYTTTVNIDNVVVTEGSEIIASMFRTTTLNVATTTIKNVTMEGNNTIGSSAFYGVNFADEALTEVSDYFNLDTRLATYETAPNIGSYAFAYSTMPYLTSIEIGEQATVGSYAFFNLYADKLTTLNITGATSIGSYAFALMNTALTYAMANDETNSTATTFSIHLKDVKAMLTGSIANANITKITLEFTKVVSSPDYEALLAYNSRTINVDTIEIKLGESYPTSLGSSNGIFGAYATGDYINTVNIDNVIVEEGTPILPYMFRTTTISGATTNIANVTLGGNNTIGSYAFYNVNFTDTALTEVISYFNLDTSLEEGGTALDIGSYAFMYASMPNLISINIGTGATVGSNAFVGLDAPKLANVNIIGATSIGTYAFANMQVPTAIAFYIQDTLTMGEGSLATLNIGSIELNFTTTDELTVSYSRLLYLNTYTINVGTITLSKADDATYPSSLSTYCVFGAYTTSTSYSNTVVINEVIVEQDVPISSYMFRTSNVDTASTTINNITFDGNNSIGGYAFAYTSLPNLTALAVDGAVGTYAFYGSSLDSLTTLTIDDDIGSCAFAYASLPLLESLVIDTTTNTSITVGERAFYYASMDSITTIDASGVYSIGTYAFSKMDAPNLTDINASNVDKIYGYAFSATDYSSVTLDISDVYYMANYAIGTDISFAKIIIGLSGEPQSYTDANIYKWQYLISGESSVVDFVIDGCFPQSNYQYVFTTSTTELSINKLTVTSGSSVYYGAFYMASNVSGSVTINEAIFAGNNAIGAYAFTNATIKTITGMTNVTSIGAYGFAISEESNITTLALESIEKLESYSLSISTLQSVTISGNSLTSMHGSTFAGCSELASITILPTGVTLSSAFTSDIKDDYKLYFDTGYASAYSIKTYWKDITDHFVFDTIYTSDGIGYIVMVDGNLAIVDYNVEKITDENAELGTVTIPSTINVTIDTTTEIRTVTSIYAGAFASSAITEVILPKTLTSISTQAFSGVNITSITMSTTDSGTSNFMIEDNVIYTADYKDLIYYHHSKTNTFFYVPSGVEYIHNYAINNDKLETIYMFNMDYIADNAFAYADNLEKFYLLGQVTVTSILSTDVFGAFYTVTISDEGVTTYTPTDVTLFCETGMKAEYAKSYIYTDIIEYMKEVPWNYGDEGSTDADNVVVYIYDKDGGYEVKNYIYDENSTDTVYPLDAVSNLADGYTFGGWYGYSSASDTGTQITEITYSDKYVRVAPLITPIEYGIEYELNGGNNHNYNPSTYNIETTTFTFEDPTKDGYEFKGWIGKDGEPITGITEGTTGEITITATWSAIEYKVTYSFDENFTSSDGLASGTKVAFDGDNPIVLPELTCTIAGYVFDGWYTAETGGTKYTTTEGLYDNTILYAQYVADKFTITYMFNDETYESNNSGNPTSYQTSEVITFLDATTTQEGYVFVGWYTDDSYTTKITSTSGYTDHLTLYALFSEDSYTITYIYDGNDFKYSVDGSSNFTVNNPITEDEMKILTCTKNGYEFAGWFTSQTYREGEQVTTTEDILDDITVYAQYRPIEYTITYELGANKDEIIVNDNPETYTIEDDTITFVAPIRAGYKFVSWDTAEIIGGSYNDVTVTATWETITYTITYVTNGGTNPSANSTEYTVEKNVNFGDATANDGYKFVGWYLDSEYTTEITSTQGYTEDLTLYAKWESSAYSIIYELNGGTNYEDNPSEYYYSTTDSIQLNDPERVGYDFAGWYTTATFDDDTKVTEIAKGSIGEKTLYAKWTPITYYITYDLDDGTIADDANPSEYTIETATITLAEPSKTGYTFDGWYSGNTKFTEITLGSTGTLALTASWTAIEYKITYVLGTNGVNGDNPETYTIESDTITFEDPSRVGYEFAGWVDADGNAITQIEKGTTGGITITAKWTAITYYITYDLDDGTIADDANPSEYTIETATITLAEPSKTGYTFDGWYSGNTKFTEITLGSTGTLALTASWTAIEYKITYVLGTNGVNGDNPETYTIESDTITFEDPSRVGYEFAGWVDENGSPITQITVGSTGAVTITATWSLNTYSITYELNDDDDDSTVNNNPTEFTVESATITFADPSRVGYTFTGWYTAETGGEKVTQITAGSYKNVTIYATWIVYAVDEVSISDNGLYYIAYSTFTDDTNLATLFGITATDTDGEDVTDITSSYVINSETNTATITFTITGLRNDTSGSLATATYTIEGIKVYYTPTITATADAADSSDPYLNLSSYSDDDGASLISWFGVTATATHSEDLAITVSVDGTIEAGQIIEVTFTATDIAGNTQTLTISNVKVYGTPIITIANEIDYVGWSYAYALAEYNEDKSLYFGQVAVDSFGESLDIYYEEPKITESDGESSISYIFTTEDSRGNTAECTRTVNIYPDPVIEVASSITLSLYDGIEYTLLNEDTLGITVISASTNYTVLIAYNFTVITSTQALGICNSLSISIMVTDEWGGVATATTRVTVTNS